MPLKLITLHRHGRLLTASQIGSLPQLENSKENLQKSVNVNGLSISRTYVDHLTTEIEPVLPCVKVADTAFVLEEVVVARKQVKEGKSPG